MWNLQDIIYSIFSNLNGSVETLIATVVKAQQDKLKLFRPGGGETYQVPTISKTVLLTFPYALSQCLRVPLSDGYVTLSDRPGKRHNSYTLCATILFNYNQW